MTRADILILVIMIGSLNLRQSVLKIYRSMAAHIRHYSLNYGDLDLPAPQTVR